MLKFSNKTAKQNRMSILFKSVGNSQFWAPLLERQSDGIVFNVTHRIFPKIQSDQQCIDGCR